MKKISGYDAGFKFSKDQRESLWGIVRQKFGPKKATLLINELELSCRWTSWRESKDQRTHRETLRAMLKTFQHAEKYITKLGTYSPVLPANQSMREIVGYKSIPISPNPRNLDINFFSRTLAKEISPSLKGLIQVLEDALKLQSPKIGRTRNSPSPFIRQIAEDYLDILGERPKNGGLFLRLVQELLLFAKLPSQNPRRAVREALKSLN